MDEATGPSRPPEDSSTNDRFNEAAGPSRPPEDSSTNDRFNEATGPSRPPEDSSTNDRFNEAAGPSRPPEDSSTNDRFNEAAGPSRPPEDSSTNDRFNEATGPSRPPEDSSTNDRFNEAAGPSRPPEDSSTNDRFNEAKAILEASVQRNVKTYESSEEEDDLEEDQIFRAVTNNFATCERDKFELGRTTDYLKQCLQSGGLVCLICLESVKRQHAIWSCWNCFAAYHLNCIQKWSQDTINIQHIRQEMLGPSILFWQCPKCRNSYQQDEVPQIYYCFCGKTTDPPFDPWTLPHSCNSICGKPLPSKCEHVCWLTCHPGPCPPCPKFVSKNCYCMQSTPRMLRCSTGGWNCGLTCNKLLTCQVHTCKLTCHDGDCLPCENFKSQSCLCGSHVDIIKCNYKYWKCDKICEKKLCEFHICDQECHTGDCGPCPKSGLQTCPCGSVMEEVICPNEVPTCGNTCDKMLSCNYHSCPHKCHKDACPSCMVLYTKQCRCGLHFKELPCHKQYLCDTKCKKMRVCGKHPCNKKCCDKDCPPCDKPCGKMLQCGKHKCLAMCHQGSCYPCISVAEVRCRCGKTKKTVPCGTEKKTKPPKCNNPCKKPALCGHTKENLHPCHFGACPSCRQICNKELRCKHICKYICHQNVEVIQKCAKADTPCDQQQDTTQFLIMPCSPCGVPVTVNCLGLHEEEISPCYLATISSCGRQCGRKLKCKNHSCTLECHPVGNNSTEEATPLCDTCLEKCSLPKPPGCVHPCNKQCHPAPCDPCQQYLKRKCHCGLTELYLQCFEFNTTDDVEKYKKLSCKEQCNRLLECGHRCRSNCHSGECPTLENCTRKTKIFCACRRIKKDVLCNLAKTVVIQCDDICDKIIAEEKTAKRIEEESRQLQEEDKKQQELLQYLNKFGQKKRKQRKVVENKVEKSFISKYWIIASALVVVIVGSALMATYLPN